MSGGRKYNNKTKKQVSHKNKEKKPLWKQLCFFLCAIVFLLAVSSFFPQVHILKKEKKQQIQENKIQKETQDNNMVQKMMEENSEKQNQVEIDSMEEEKEKKLVETEERKNIDQETEAGQEELIKKAIEENQTNQQKNQTNQQENQVSDSVPNATCLQESVIQLATELLLKNAIPVTRFLEIEHSEKTYKSQWIKKVFTTFLPITAYSSEYQRGSQTKAVNVNHTKMEDSISKENEKWNISADLVGGEVGSIPGEVYYEDLETEFDSVEEQKETAVTEEKLAIQNQVLIEQLKKKRTTEYLIQNFFIVDTTTVVDKELFQVDKLLGKDMTMEKKKNPQILIYHTHGASEAFSDSRKGKEEDSIIGVGEVLADILQKEYGYEVIHDTKPYDLINGAIDRNKGYNQALPALEETLKEHDSIEVLIDLHRDAGSTKRVTMIDGKPTAQIMLFNGLSRNLNGAIGYLKNPNLQGNLAFSLQLKLAAMEQYPDFAKKIYLKGYRYNLHLKEKSILVELGTVSNTVEEAKNAMKPLANILNSVLQGK